MNSMTGERTPVNPPAPPGIPVARIVPRDGGGYTVVGVRDEEIAAFPRRDYRAVWQFCRDAWVVVVPPVYTVSVEQHGLTYDWPAWMATARHLETGEQLAAVRGFCTARAAHDAVQGTMAMRFAGSQCVTEVPA